MARLIVQKGTINITEQTVKELMKAIEKAKETMTFTDEPMPEGDMSPSDHNRLMAERGQVLVGSEFSTIDFRIDLEVTPNSQESLGYSLEIQ